jgi:hypothetical protein
VKQVKNYIEEKYRTANAPAYFPRYGIVKENGTFQLPRDRNERLEAFAQMLAGLLADGLGDKEFGTTYCDSNEESVRHCPPRFQRHRQQRIYRRGFQEWPEGRDQKSAPRPALCAARQLPDTYAAEYRAWGLQKEDY